MNNGPFQSYLASKAASDGTTHSKVTTFQKKTSDITIDIKHLANYFLWAIGPSFQRIRLRCREKINKYLYIIWVASVPL